jgi:hypothetical protein
MVQRGPKVLGPKKAVSSQQSALSPSAVLWASDRLDDWRGSFTIRAQNLQASRQK